MAQATERPRKPTFYEVVFEGAPKRVRGFLAGLRLGVGGESTIFYHYDECVHHEGLGARLAEMVHLSKQDCHVIVDTDLKRRLQKLAPRIEAEAQLRIRSSRFIRSASLPFHFEAFADRYGQEISYRLHNLPDGLRLVDFEQDEKRDPRAEGVEAYAPAHHYEIRGSGRVVGRVDLLIEARRLLDSHPLIAVGEITLKLA
jgi:hypothetical protein